MLETTLDITLNGPEEMRSGGWGNFTATISHGSGNYWCEWYKKVQGTLWIHLGGSPFTQKMIRMMDDEMTVKVEVRDNVTNGQGSAKLNIKLRVPEQTPG